LWKVSHDEVNQRKEICMTSRPFYAHFTYHPVENFDLYRPEWCYPRPLIPADFVNTANHFSQK
jgi:hypothetical protein